MENLLPSINPAAELPDLYEANIKELQHGLDNGDFTSGDLVKVNWYGQQRL